MVATIAQVVRDMARICEKGQQVIYNKVFSVFSPIWGIGQFKAKPYTARNLSL